MLAKVKFGAIWLILLSTFALFSTGCTYERTLNPNLELAEVPQNLPKYDMSVGIVIPKEIESTLVTGDISLKLYPGIIHLITSSLNGIFDKVSVIRESGIREDDRKFDLLLYPQWKWNFETLVLDFQMPMSETSSAATTVYKYEKKIKIYKKYNGLIILAILPPWLQACFLIPIIDSKTFDALLEAIEIALQDSMKTMIKDLAYSPFIISCYVNKKKNDGTDWATLAKSPEKIMRNALAIDTRTPTNILEQLADDPDCDIRRSIAQNRSTPSYVLERMSKDPNQGIQQAVATNPNTPRNVVTMMILSGYTLGDDERGEIALNDRLIEWKNNDLPNFFSSSSPEQIKSLIITMEKACMRLEIEAKKFKNKKDEIDMQINANRLRGTQDAGSQELAAKFSNLAQTLELRTSLINGIIEAARSFLDK